MKPKFLSFLLLFCVITFSAYAQKKQLPEPVSKAIRLDGSFTSLIVEDDLFVVLTESNSGELIVTGNEQDVKKLKAQLDGGQLVLSFMPSFTQPDIKIYVPAGLLRKINVNGKSHLTSAFVLTNPNLSVIVGGEGKVALQSNGKLTVLGNHDYDFIRTVR